MDTTTKPRLLWVDLLRALAAIFVVIVHAIPSSSGEYALILRSVISPIMIPLFFAISGYLFNIKDGKPITLLKRLLNGLIVPTIFLSFIWLKIVLIPFRGISFLGNELYDLISGKTYWYINACIIAEIIFFFTRKYAKTVRSTCIVSLTYLAIGLVLAKLNIGNFSMFNRALIAQAYMVLGFLIKTHEESLSKVKWSAILIPSAFYIVLIIFGAIQWPTQPMDIHTNRYPHLPYCLLTIFIGIITLFLIARKIKKIPSIIVFIGQNSLYFYVLQFRMFAICNKAFNLIGIHNTDALLFQIVKICAAIIGCSIIAFVFNKLFPQFVGKKRLLKC